MEVVFAHQMAIKPCLSSFSSRYFASVSYSALSAMGGVGIDLELWRARVGMYHAARCRSQRREKTPKLKRQIPLMRTCFQALAVLMMVSLAPAVVNMLLIMAGDVEPNPGPGQLFFL